MKTIIYRKSLIFFIVNTTICLLTIMVFNYYAGHGKLFVNSTKMEEVIADAQLNNKKILFPYNYNDRSVEKIYLEKKKDRTDVLIIGSSRSMPIGQKSFKNHSFFNGSVTSASLEDILAIYYLYQKKGQPKILVLSLDPWILDKNHGMKKWKFAFLSEYFAARKLVLNSTDNISYLYNISNTIEKYSQLLSSEFTFHSFKSIILPSNEATKEVIIDPVDNPCPTCFTRLPDGTRIYPDSQESATPDEAAIAIAMRQYADDYGDYNQLDLNYIILFEGLIHHLLRNNIKVIFYLPAYHPVAWSLIKSDKKYKMVLTAEEYFISIASRYNLKVIGSYDPKKLNLNSNDFVDDIHLKKQPIEDIFKKQMV